MLALEPDNIAAMKGLGMSLVPQVSSAMVTDEERRGELARERLGSAFAEC